MSGFLNAVAGAICILVVLVLTGDLLVNPDGPVIQVLGAILRGILAVTAPSGGA